MAVKFFHCLFFTFLEINLPNKIDNNCNFGQQMTIFFAIFWINVSLFSSMHLSDEVITWRCAAVSKNHSYLVKMFDATLSSFDLIVYQGQGFQDANHLETLIIDIIKNDNQGLVAQGKREDNQPILITAFEGSLSFRVDDPLWGIAVGRCERNIEFN